MKKFRGLWTIVGGAGITLQTWGSFLDTDHMKEVPVTVERAGENLDKFSENLHENIISFFDFFKNFINDPFRGLGHTSFDFLIHYKNFHFLKLLIVIGGALAVFGLIRSMTAPLWAETSRAKKYMPMDTGERIFFYLLPWFGFMGIGALLANMLELAPLLRLMIYTTFFILATGHPLQKTVYLSKPISAAPGHISFLRRWIIYIIILGLISLVLIVFFSFICPLIVDLAAAERHYTFINSPIFFFWTKTVFYFYLINLAIFLIHLEQQIEKASPSSPNSDFLVLSRWQALWKEYSLYWYFLCDGLLLLTFANWVAVSFGWINITTGQTFFIITTVLVVITLNGVTQRVLVYLAGKISYRLFSRKADSLFHTTELIHGGLYLLYWFGLFCLGAYIWDNPFLYNTTTHLIRAWGEKVCVVGGIIFSTACVTNWIQHRMRSIINSRTQRDVAMRSWSRIYTLFSMLHNVVSILLWVPAGVIILNYSGVEGRHILFGLGGFLGVVMWIGQGALQDMVKGFFYVLGDVIVIGEAVYVDGTAGRVERVSLHSFSIRDPEGFVHTFSYGKINSIVCTEWTYAHLLAQATITYDSDQDKAMRIMKEVFHDLKRDKNLRSSIHDAAMHVSLKKLGDHGVVIEGFAKIVPSHLTLLKSEYYMRLKNAFDAHKIRLAAPLTSYYKK